LACGDSTGYGLHGDFLNGWDPDVVQNIITDPSCQSDNTAEGNNPKNCNALVKYIQEADSQGNCKIENPTMQNEDFGLNHMIDHLPGCNSINTGPGIAPMCRGTTPQKILTTGVRRVALQSKSNMMYLSAPSFNILSASVKQNVTYSEIFELIPTAGGYAIQSDELSMFLTASNPVLASRNPPQNGEIWTIKFSADNKSATIWSNAAKMYLSVQADGHLAANQANAGDTETFWVVDVNPLISSTPCVCG